MTKKSTGKTSFYCTACGHEHIRWEGKCRGCDRTGTLEEAPTAKDDKRAPGRSRALLSGGASSLPGSDRPIVLKDVEGEEGQRLLTGLAEFDFVLGGGIVRGSIVLLGGEPGIGKSTILTQVSARLKERGHTVLYASGEESARQVKLRAVRLGGHAEEVSYVAEPEIGRLLEHTIQMAPEVLIVDSIQTLYADDLDGAPGQPGQLKECAARLQRYAKDSGTAVFLVGHVTKDGALAGPKILEHIVDATVYFAHVGDGEHRIMRAAKNRFGSVDEIGVFRMTAAGLEPVPNPSEVFLADRAIGASGSAVTAVLEGSRPVLVELQGLATIASYGTPQRVATGFSRKRLAILVAVLEKRAGLPFSNYDVFVNVVGGLTLQEPAADAALMVALASSAWNKAVPPNAIFLGEVGLGGEMRRVGQVERRLQEAAQMGFTTAYLAKRSMPRQVPEGMRVVGVDTVAELIRTVLSVETTEAAAPATHKAPAGRGGAKGNWSSTTKHRTSLQLPQKDDAGTGDEAVSA
jgi:DNA repair protein RadA/Sms